MDRIIIGATGSGVGKTSLVCGLLRALQNRGVKVCAFKCGPDYIDPMFHREVLGIPSRNLDLFFMGQEGSKYLLDKNAKAYEFAVIEGVMGYYDGLAMTTDKASAYDLAEVTETPAILLVDGRGKARSLLAEIEGFLKFRKDSHIRGLIINRISKAVYEMVKAEIEDRLGVSVLGFLPDMEGVEFESRHLGLINADEVKDIGRKIDKIAKQVEETVDIDRILDIGSEAGPISVERDYLERLKNLSEEKGGRVKLAVALDKAFCFYYEDNLDLLREMGAELEFFSPLAGDPLPEQARGLILAGGYPELYTRDLEESPTTDEIRLAIDQGLPCLAESGGFIYLHGRIEDKNGNRARGVGVFEKELAFPRDSLVRFGYINIEMKKDSILGQAGTVFRGHEFHYWDSTNPGRDCRAKKPVSNREWDCIIARDNLFVGFPHIHFYSNPLMAKNFLEACRRAGS